MAVFIALWLYFQIYHFYTSGVRLLCYSPDNAFRDNLPSGFRSLSCCGFLVMRYPFHQMHFELSPNILNACHLRDVPVTLSVLFGSLRVYSCLRNALKWHLTIRTRSLRCTHIPHAEISYHLCSDETYVLRYAVLTILQAPQRLRVSACFLYLVNQVDSLSTCASHSVDKLKKGQT